MKKLIILMAVVLLASMSGRADEKLDSEGVAEPLNSKSLRIDYSRQTLKLSDSDRIFGSREFKI